MNVRIKNLILFFYLKGLFREIKELSPPTSTSTPLGTPDTADSRNKKPALPPKPAIPVKPTPPPPPRQAHLLEGPESKGYVEITAESLEQALNLKLGGGNIKTDEVPFDSEHSRSPTPPPPPPPTTEPPDDHSSRRSDNQESGTKDEKIDTKIKLNQSSNVVNSNQSGTQQNNNVNSSVNNNNNINNNNINNNIINNNNNINNLHLHHQNNGHVSVSMNRRIDMPPAFLFPETEVLPTDLIQASLNEGGDKYINLTKAGGKNSEKEKRAVDEIDRVITNGNENCVTNSKGRDDKKTDVEDIESSNNKTTPDTQKNSGI